jgi:hypothetical protein
MRVSAQAVWILLVSLPAMACGGGDLALPNDASPAVLRIVAGDGQSATEGSPVADPLVVQLEDGSGQPFPGAQVEFGFVGPLPGAVVDPGSVPTDELGRAEVRARLGHQEGVQTIEALVAAPGKDLRVHFRLTALAADDGAGASGDGSGRPPPPPGGDDGGGGGNQGNGDGGSGGNGGGGHGHRDHGKGHGKGHGHGHDD